MSSLKDYFRPEFLNRVDDTIIFDILSPEAIKDIVKIQVEQVVKRLTDKSISLNLSPAVYEYLAKEGYNPQYGARPLKRLIQNKILTPVANLLISQEVVKGGTIEVGVKPMMKGAAADAPVEFSFEVKKKHKNESPLVSREMVGQK
jgi:ATP-dependent Clp protease ATP-binding subunit ClpA